MLTSTLAALGYPLRRQILISVSRTLGSADINGILVVDSQAAPRTVSLQDGDQVGAGGFFQISAPFGSTNPVTVIFPAGNTYNQGKPGPIVLANDDDSVFVIAGPGKTWVVLFGDASSASTTWAQTLVNGNVSGGRNPTISQGDFLSLQGNADLLSDTLANLKNKDAANGIVANRTVARVEDLGRWAEALTVLVGSSTWGYKNRVSYAFAGNLSNAGTISFIGWYFRDGRLTTIAWDNVLVLPHNGTVVEMGIYSDSANPGNTTFGLHLGVAGADPSVVPNVVSGTLNYTGTDQLKTWVPNFDVVGGQKLAASFTPTNASGTFQGYVEIDYLVVL